MTGHEIAGFDVSRETAERLDLYLALLVKWNKAINLVAPATLDQAWDRHFVDSAQLLSIAPEAATNWVDLGSGGGFPGLVVAVLARELRPGLHVTLVESDARKAAFLTEVAWQTGLAARIISGRAETVPPLGADLLSARALAPLTVLLGLAERHLAPGGTAVFPKGAQADSEIKEALETFRFRLQKIPSQTDPDAAILSVGDIYRV